MQGPGDDASGQRGKDDIDVEVVDIVAPDAFVSTQVEDAVGAERGGCSVIQIKEPDGAVDEGETHRQQGIDGADSQAVEGKLQGLVGGLADLPADVRCDREGQDNRQQPPPVL